MADILAKLREMCLALPGAEETITFGHPTFRATGKAFAVLEEYKGELSIAFQWVSLRVSSRCRGAELRELLAESHRLAVAKRAPKRAVQGKHVAAIDSRFSERPPS